MELLRFMMADIAYPPTKWYTFDWEMILLLSLSAGNPADISAGGRSICYKKEMLMKVKNRLGAIIVMFVFTMGCIDYFVYLREKSQGEQNVIIQQLKDNLNQYNIHRSPWRLTVFDPKNDDRKLEVIDMKTIIVDEKAKSDFDVKIFPRTGIREVLGTDGQLFGYITWDDEKVSIGVRRVDAKTMRLYADPLIIYEP
ncbi:hypothetical protein ACFLZM_03910 [Thermodesulfobacteriota bacterium]